MTKSEVSVGALTHSLHQNGFATFRTSFSPVIGSLNSFQLIGYIVLPASLFAIMTPSSLRAVVR